MGGREGGRERGEGGREGEREGGRERGREGGREGKKFVCVTMSHTNIRSTYLAHQLDDLVLL